MRNVEDVEIPIITSLMMDNTSHNVIRPRPPPPWNEPFLELLCFLKIIDRFPVPPIRIDGQFFCFQPSNDLSTMSRIYLSVNAPFVKGDIDLDKFPLPSSYSVLPALIKLQDYALHVLQRVRRFRDRLIERNIIHNPAIFLQVDLFTCPLCLHPLASCFDCDNQVACSNPTCQGRVDCEFCYEDVHRRMICHACIATNTFPSLVRCPLCHDWSCREDVGWCSGLVKNPVLGTNELAELSRECNWDSETIVRSHPPRPGPCYRCLEHDYSLDFATCRNKGNYLYGNEREPYGCPSQTLVMTFHRLRGAYCPECVAQSPGHSCACEKCWLCETCFTIRNKTGYPLLIRCPRCGIDYCTEPDADCEGYIDICRGCNGVILCSDCHEEEALPGTQTTKTLPQRVVFDGQCSYCEAFTCNACRHSPRSVFCSYCCEWFCYGCLSDMVHIVIRQCPSCGFYVCTDCKKAHETCPGIVVMSQTMHNLDSSEY